MIPTLLSVALTNKTPASKLELPPKLETLPEIVTLECVVFPVTTKAFAKPGLTINVPLTVAVLVTDKLAVVNVLTTPTVRTLALLAYRSHLFVVSPNLTLLALGNTLALNVDSPATDSVLLKVAAPLTLIVVAESAHR